jgi:hypothetical protein
VIHQAYVALPSGRDRFDCLDAALRLLGWELRDRHTTRERQPLDRHTIAWSHLPAEPDTPGLLRIGGAWDPRLVWALSQVSGQFAVAHLDDRTRSTHHFAVGYAGVRVLERAGDEDQNVTEFNRLVQAAAELDPLLFRVDDQPSAEVVTYVPDDEPFETVPELSRILVADVAELDPPDGWECRTDDPYGARYWALQRRGPLDERLVEALAGVGEVLAIHVADGGRVRWRHLGAGHDDSGEGAGWEPITQAWARHAPHLLLPPPEIDWPRIRR